MLEQGLGGLDLGGVGTRADSLPERAGHGNIENAVGISRVNSS
jgi:hypothetical protein